MPVASRLPVEPCAISGFSLIFVSKKETYIISLLKFWLNDDCRVLTMCFLIEVPFVVVTDVTTGFMTDKMISNPIDLTFLIDIGSINMENGLVTND